MNILVVDDDEGILRLVSRMLRNGGHRAFTTTDAHQALETIERQRVDLLISDVAMPAMTGPELVAIAQQRRPELPVLYISASERPDGCAFLAKPFLTRDLLNAVDRASATYASGSARPGISNVGHVRIPGM